MAMRRATLGGLSAMNANNRSSAAPSRQSSIGGKRQSLAAPRKSLASGDLSRRSSVFGRGGSVKSDPRPIDSKKYFHESIKRVIAYLTEHAYDRTISLKMLTTPTTKDFQFVLEFLLRGVDPNYAMDSGKTKFEDEVIGVFKALGYPFEIRKQALYTVGSPHSWPALVATLTWLIDILEYDEEVQARKEEDCFDADVTFKIFFDYLTKAYRKFLDGDDDCPDLDEELSMVFDARNAQVKAEVKQLADANAELQAQLAALRGETSPLEAATRQSEDLNSDLGKFRKLVSQMTQHEEQLTTKVQDRTHDAAAVEAELGAVLADVEALRQTLSTQELSPADVQRMNGERNRLEAELKSLIANKEAKTSEVLNAEVVLSQSMDQLGSLLNDYTNRATRLQLIPSSAANAAGRSLECDLAASNVTVGGTVSLSGAVLTIDLLGEARPVLAELKEKFTSTLHEAQAELLKLQDQLDRSEQSKQDKEEEVSDLERKAHKLEAIFNSEKETLFGGVDEEVRRSEDVLSQALALRSELAAKRSASQQAMSAASAEVETQKRAWQAEREQLYSELIATLDRLMSHKEQIRDRLQSVLSAAEHTRATVADVGDL